MSECDLGFHLRDSVQVLSYHLLSTKQILFNVLYALLEPIDFFVFLVECFGVARRFLLHFDHPYFKFVTLDLVLGKLLLDVLAETVIVDE